MRNSEQRYENILRKAKEERQERIHRRRMWVTCGTALSVAVLAFGATAYYQRLRASEEDSGETERNADITVPAIDSWQEELGQPEPWYHDGMTPVNYFIPTENGKYLLTVEKYETIPSNEEIVKNYLSMCKAEGVLLERIDMETIEATEGEKDGMAFYYAEIRTANVYLSGEQADDAVMIGLVNTLYDSGCNFIRLFHNGEKVILDGAYAEGDSAYNAHSFRIDVIRPEEEEEPPFAENWEVTVPVSHQVVDEDGNPLSNITYSYRYISGEYGSYQSGYGITGSDGSFTRELHPNAVYQLVLQKRSCVSYTEHAVPAAILEEMVFEVEITEGTQLQLVWKDSEVSKVDTVKNQVTLILPDEVDGSKEDVFVQVFTENGGQVQLGYTDANGSFVWYNYTEGIYLLNAMRLDKNNDTVVAVRTYRVQIDGNGMEVLEENVQMGPQPE